MITQTETRSVLLYMNCNIIVYVLVIILVIYIGYNLDVLLEYVGQKSPRLSVYDLNGYYFNSVNLNHLYKPKIFVYLPEGNEHYSHMGLTFLCIKSIIENCGHHYDVILFDNSNIKDILVSQGIEDTCCNEDPSTLNDVQKQHWVEYCKCKILYEFGGAMIEPSFYFRKCPSKQILQSRAFSVLHYVNEGLYNTNEQLVPSTKYFMVSGKHNSDLKIYLKYLQSLYESPNDFGPEQFNMVFKHLKKLHKIPSKLFAIVNENNEKIFYHDWISANKPLKLTADHYGFFFNTDMLKKERKHGWLLKMTPKQVLETHTNLGHYMRSYYFDTSG